jgi:transposase InsO family protein
MNRVNTAEEGMEYQEDGIYSDTDVQENEGEDQTDAADEDEGVYNVVEVDTSEYRDNRNNVGNSITTISQTGSNSVVGQIIHPDDPEFLTLLANAIVLEHVNVIEEIISDGEVVASVFQRRLGASGIHEGIVDGGSQIHCTGVDSILYDKTRLQEPIYVNGVGGQRVVTIVGKILIKLNHGKGLFLTGVRYIPGFHSTIISVTQLQKSGVEVITANNSCYLVEKQLVQRLDLSERNKQVLLHVPQRAGLYKLKLGEKPIASPQKGILVDKEDVKQVKQTLEEASTKLPRVQKKESRNDSDVEAESDHERSSAEMRQELMQRRLTRSQSQAIARGSNSAANGASKQHNVNGNRAASEEKSHSQGSVNTVEEVNTVMEEQIHVVKQKDNFSADPNVNEYHCRLAHPSAKSLLLFAKKFGLDKLTEVLKLMKKKNKCSCEVCITTRIPSELQIGKRNARRSPLADRRMHTWHVDLIGPFSTIEKDGKRYNLPSIHGHRFALVAIDEQARYIFVIPLQCKSDAPKKLIELIKQKQVEFGMTLVVLRTDKGGEFTSEELAAFLSANGTEHAFSPTDTPQYNGLVERANQTLIRDAKSMLEQCGGSQALWSYALTYAATIHNMMPIPSLHGIVPAEEMYGAERIEEIKRHLPCYQTFGCNVYVHQHKDEHGKFQPHKIPGVYLGWNEEKRYYRVLINTNNRLQVIEAHDVSFIDTTFDQLAEWNNAIRMRSEQMVGINNGNEVEYEVEAIYADRQTKSGKEYLVKWTGYHYPTWEPEKGLTNCAERLKEYHGLRKTPIRSGDMVYNLAEPTRAETSKDSKSTESYHGGSVDVPLDYVEPKTFKAAMADKYKIYWLMAIREEINSLLMLNVFSPIKSYPIGRKPLTTTWVLKVKRDKDNKVIRWKARLVVQGYLQKYGIDFTETHSPTGRMKVIKYVIATAAKYDLEIKQIDYDVAFLNATLPEEVLITIPDGFELGDGVRSMGYCACLKLNKALYGLKQAPREWNKEIDGFLRSIGYSATTLDECLYFKRVGNKKIYLTLFVDDTLAVYPKEIENVWEEDKKAISQRYKIKDIGDCEWIFNMHLVRDRAKRTITLSQEAYMDKMLKEYGFSDEVRTVSTPFQYGDVSQIEKDCPEEELKLLTPAEQMEYRSKIGSLLYAANITRVDLQYIIGTLARYLTSPLVRHMKAVNRVLRYVCSTKQYKLRFDYSDERQRQGCKLIIYTDSNWAQESEDKKSTGGWLATLNGAIVAWQSKKQSTVALSSTEAEYYALTEAVKECLFLRQLFAEYDLNNGEDISIDIKCDNRGAIEMSDHATDHNRSKHIDIKHHFIRQCVHDKLVRVSYIETKKQLADILTKSVKVGTYQQLLKMIYSEEKE